MTPTQLANLSLEWAKIAKAPDQTIEQAAGEVLQGYLHPFHGYLAAVTTVGMAEETWGLIHASGGTRIFA